MGAGLTTKPSGPLVDKQGQITQPWFQAFLVGGALSIIVNLVTEVTGILRVVNGGTGRASLTAHNVLLGNGTSPVNFAPPVTAGYVLTDNGVGVDPTFQNVGASAADETLAWLAL